MLRYCLSIYFFFALLFTTNAQTTVVLSAVKDNTIYQIATGNSNGIGENIFAGNNSSSSPRRALIKFDISAQVPAGASITSVILTLYCTNATSGINNVNVHPLLADWGEGKSDALGSEGTGIAATTNDATWLSRFHLTSLWTTPGGDYSSTASATTAVGAVNTSYNWASPHAVADVQGWLNNPATNFGWILIGNETIPQSAKRFASRENTIAAQRPQLSVTYTTTVPVVFTFTGSGNWNDAANWSNSNIPPANLPAASEIIIDPAANGECVLNVPQTILSGGKITVQANKKFRVSGNLTIQ